MKENVLHHDHVAALDVLAEILNDPDQVGNSMLSPARGNSVGTELEGAIRRSYFIVGNLLMDDKIEAIQ